MTPTAVLFVIGAYLWGGIPSAYLAARYRSGIDIRQYGSGNVGAANIYSHVGKRIGLLLGTFDCVGKGVLPVIAAKLLDQSLAVQVAVALAAILGHNWSPYIRFTGGRGVATAIGVVLVFEMWWEWLILGVALGAIGRLIFKDTAFWTFLSMLALPLLAFIFSRPPELVYMSVGIGLLLLLKRLTANWERPLSVYSLHRVMLYRILWDRDVPKNTEWTRRLPFRE